MLRIYTVCRVGIVLCGLFFFLFFTVHAQQSAPVGTLVADRRAELERNLATLEKEIEAQRVVLESKQRETVTLERDVAILTAKIEKARLSLKARTLVIERLRGDIDSKEGVIDNLNEKLERERESLAQLIRKTNEIDEYTFAEVVLSNRELSEFFSDIDSFAAIKQSLNASFQEITTTRQVTEKEKEELESKVSEEEGLRKLQQVEAQRIQDQERQKTAILKESKGQEALYQKIIKEKEKTAAEIRTELFSLRGSAAIPFEKAYEYAVKAGNKMNVRPAFILGIIAEESNLGQNVGTGNWRVDMKAPRDTVPFMDITKRLGLNPDEMPVSKKPWYGYGGAMGPAQFIPSTWVLYEERIAEETGHNPPNPWDPGDAFMAAAILLADNGANKGTRQAERLAALRYLAGWVNATKPQYAFYGDDVMELADKYQKQIDILQADN